MSDLVSLPIAIRRELPIRSAESTFFENITVGGNARVHIGNSIQNVNVTFAVSSQPQSNSTTILKDASAYTGPIGLCLGQAPYISSSLFIGRNEDIEKIDKVVQDRADEEEQKRIVLGGMGGVGKTQLAIGYARSRQKTYDSVLWFNAASEITLRASFQVMAQRISQIPESSKIEIEQAVLQVKRWLSDLENSRWLLIFDNYDEPKAYNIESYYPQTSHGTILITTRVPDEVGGARLRIRPLENVDHSLQILQTRSERKIAVNDVQARNLARRLDGLPLALATAGSYLQKSFWSFEQYLDMYERQWNINKRQPKPLQEYQDRTLYTTWDLSYQRLEREDEEASLFLKLLVYFDHQDLWYELFHAGAREDLPDWLCGLINDEAEFDSMMHLLVEYCFIDLQPNRRTYSLHACVHDWITAKSVGAVEQKYYWFAFDCIAAPLAGVSMSSLGLLKYARLLIHAMRLFRKQFREIRSSMSSSRLHSTSDIVVFLQAQSQSRLAEEVSIEALNQAKAAAEPDEALIFELLYGMGQSCLAQDKSTDALSIYKQCLLLADNDRLKDNDQNALLAAYGVARTLLAMDDQISAEEWLVRTYEKSQILNGSTDTITLTVLNCLAVAYDARDKVAEAQVAYEKALVGWEDALGTDNPSTLRTVNNLARLCARCDQAEKAENLYTRALAVSEKTFGPAHEATLESVCALGTFYVDQERLTEAQVLLVRALEGQEQLLGNEDLSTLRTMTKLGLLYRLQGKLVEAEQLLNTALKGLEKAVGPGHSSTLNTLTCLGEVYMDQERAAEAEDSLLRAESGYASIFGASHTCTLRATHGLGRLYVDEDRFEEAEVYLKRTLAGYEAFAVNLNSIILLMNNIALLYIYQCRFAEAKSILDQALQQCSSLANDHIRMLDTYLNFGFMYANETKYDEAETMYVKALKGYEQSVGLEHPSTLETLKCLAKAMRKKVEVIEHEEDARFIVHRLILLFERLQTKRLDLIGSLASCFLDSKDEENAAMALIQEIHLEDNGTNDFHKVWCDNCTEGITMDTGRYKCEECDDVDLCGTCMPEYITEQLDLETCQGHKFFNAGYAVRQMLKKTANDSGKLDVDSWIENLKKQYPARSSDVTVEEQVVV